MFLKNIFIRQCLWVTFSFRFLTATKDIDPLNLWPLTSDLYFLAKEVCACLLGCIGCFMPLPKSFILCFISHRNDSEDNIWFPLLFQVHQLFICVMSVTLKSSHIFWHFACYITLNIKFSMNYILLQSLEMLMVLLMWRSLKRIILGVNVNRLLLIVAWLSFLSPYYAPHCLPMCGWRPSLESADVLKQN